MRAEEFVRRIEEAMPAKESFAGAGLDEEDIAAIQAGWRAAKSGGLAPADASELARLVIEYDCSTLEISWVHFLARPREHPAGTQVSAWEADPIVVQSDGRIASFDHSVPSFRLAECAADSERFLDALEFVARIRVPERAQWQERLPEIGARCAEMAGSSASLQFWNSLLPFPQ